MFRINHDWHFRVKDLEAEITRLRMENEVLKKSALAAGVNPMMSSVAKVIQPTATVSSVPVSGPSKNIWIFCLDDEIHNFVL